MSIKAHVEVIDGKLIMTGKLTKRDTDRLKAARVICQSLEILLPEKKKTIEMVSDGLMDIIAAHGPKDIPADKLVKEVVGA